MIKYLLMWGMMLIVPIDYVFWNLFMSKGQGHRSLKQCTEDNLKQLVEL